MTKYNIAWSNFKGNFHRYIMFAISNAFAVTTFFIFLNFLYHPEIDFNNLGGHMTATKAAVNGMIISLVVIVLFSIMFITYATSLFLKSRGKEFGLLSLFGMTAKEIRSYIWIENIMISFVSIIIGLVIGMSFTKLFLMMMSYLTASNFSLYFSLKAIGITVLLFFILFQLSNVVIMYGLNRKVIVEQIKADKISRIVPKFSKFKAMLGIALLSIAYYVAWKVEGANVLKAMIPVTFLTIIASYFLITQFSLAFVTWIKRNRVVRFHKIKMISSSQLLYKLKDTAKVLFLGSILVAIVLTTSETMTSFFGEVDALSTHRNYEDFGVFYEGNEDREFTDKLISSFKELNVQTDEILRLRGYQAQNVNYDETDGLFQTVNIISNQDFNQNQKAYGLETVQLASQEMLYMHDDGRYDQYDNDISKLKGQNISLKINQSIEGLIVEEVYGHLVGIDHFANLETFVLNDKDFVKMIEGDNPTFTYTYFRFADGKQHPHESKIIIDNIIEESSDHQMYPKQLYVHQFKLQYKTLMFIGFFIAFLFLIATNSLIYFKLFNELEYDRLEYDILKKIGTTEKTINKIVKRQLAILFIIPLIFGMSHALFALKSLSNFLRTNLLRTGLITISVFMMIQFVFYEIISTMYLKKI